MSCSATLCHLKTGPFAVTCSPEKPLFWSLSVLHLRRQTIKRLRFTEEQIIGILKEHQAGLGAKELCRKHGISDATFCKWRSKYGGMDLSDARKLKALEAENARLKKMLAEHMLDVAILKEMLEKNF